MENAQICPDDNIPCPLSSNCIKNLNDKVHEKRKSAALEIQRLVKTLIFNNDRNSIKKIIQTLKQECILSHLINARKGGCIGLAATAIGLEKFICDFVKDLINPVVSCFYDSDNGVRYFACEALYNIIKVCRASILLPGNLFKEVYIGVSKLACDSDQNVKNGSEPLDRLLKDIIVENLQNLDMVSNIPSNTHILKLLIDLIKEMIYTNNSFGRQFVVSWLSLINDLSQNNYDIITMNLPKLLDGLFLILDDENLQVRKSCQVLLQRFLTEIIESNNDITTVLTDMDFGTLINILIIHSKSQNEMVQEISLSWIKAFILKLGSDIKLNSLLLPFLPSFLAAVLPCIQSSTNISFNLKPSSDSLSSSSNRTSPTILLSDSEAVIVSSSKDEPYVTVVTSSSTRKKSMTQSGEVINQALLELIIKIGNSNNNNREDLQSSVKNEEVATVPQLDSLNKIESTDDQKKLEDSSKIAMKEEFHIDIRNLILILVSHIQHNSEPTRLAVLYWISHILANIPDQVSPYIAELFPVLLNALSDSSEEVVLFDIRVLAQIAKINNAHLETLISNLVELFKSNFYLHFLLSENAKVKMDTKINSSSPAGNDTQKISTNASSKLTQTSKLNNSKDEKSSNFFDNRCSFIIRKLCLFTSPLNTYSQFSNILSSLAENDHNNLPPNSINVGINVMKKYRIQENKIQNLRFISKMVDLLNSILMTSSELFELRNQLKNIQSNKNVELFHNLYKLWCYNPIATLALCMLTQNFNHSYRLLQSFVDINITIDFLTEIDKLIQLLESPVFMFLRLKLLEPERNGDLVKTLYGILMILPQSQAFHLLNSRLKCLPHLFCHATQIDHLTRESIKTFDTQNDSFKRSTTKINGSSNEKDAKIGDNSGVGKSSEDILDYDRLLEHFKRVQSQYMTLL